MSRDARRPGEPIGPREASRRRARSFARLCIAIGRADASHRTAATALIRRLDRGGLSQSEADGIAESLADLLDHLMASLMEENRKCPPR